jgi:hypothetical protein
LCKSAADMLKFQFDKLVSDIESDNTTILNSESTMDNCFDFILEHGDYTIGKVLEFILYEKLFVAKGKTQVLQFCGFKKMHPHNPDSIVRVAFEKKSDKGMVRQYIREACVESQDLFKRVYQMFD